MVVSTWMLLFPGALWMDAVIPWCSLVACCYFLVLSGWMLLFPGALWLVCFATHMDATQFLVPMNLYTR